MNQCLANGMCLGKTLEVFANHLKELEDEEVSRLLSVEEIDKAIDPSAYLGSANVFIERALAAYREMKKVDSSTRR